MTGPSRPTFGLAGARENGLQSRGGCGRRSSSGCALSPQWLQLSVCGSPPRSDEPGWPPPSQTSQLLGGGSAGRRGLWPGPGDPVARAWRAAHSPCPPLPCCGRPDCRVGAERRRQRRRGVEAPRGEHAGLLLLPYCQPQAGSAEPDSESEVYEVAAGDAVAVAPSHAALEPVKLDFGAGEDNHVQ